MLSISKKQEYKGHLAAIYTLCCSASGVLYSGGADRHLLKWNSYVDTDAHLLARLPASIYSLYEDEITNHLFVGTSAGAIHVLDLSKGQEIKILQNHSAQVFHLKAFERLLYTSGGDGCITVIDLNTLETLHKVKVSTSKIRHIDCKEHLLALACSDETILQLNVSDLSVMQRVKAHEKACNVVRFHPYTHQLISGGWDAHLTIWNEQLQQLKSIPAHNYAIYSIVFSPDGLLCATGSRDKTIKLWNALDLDKPTTISAEKHQGHTFSVNTLLWSPHTGLLYSAGDDKKIMTWNIETYNSTFTALYP